MIYCIRTMQMKKRFRGLLNLGFLTQLGEEGSLRYLSSLPMFHLANIAFSLKKNVKYEGNVFVLFIISL